MNCFAKFCVVALSVSPLFAGTLWYNGDFDGRNGLANEINTQVTQSNIYDDFIVPAGQTWVVNSVWSDDLMSTTVSSAEWEIRSGVSAGNGGTLIASGTNAATQVATGRSGFGFTEYQVTVSGLTGITLGPGKYWLTVAPVDSGSGRSFNSTTSGANCVGMPCGNDGDSFWNSSFFGENFGPTTDGLGAGTWDFSMGIAGSLKTNGVPEPGSLGLCFGALGLAVVGAIRRRRTVR